MRLIGNQPQGIFESIFPLAISEVGMSYFYSFEQDLDDAYEEGYYDYINGYYYDECPFLDEDLAFEWEEGWLDARHNYRCRC